MTTSNYPTNFSIIGRITSVKLAEYSQTHFCHFYGESGQYRVVLPNGLIKTHAKLTDIYTSIHDFLTNEYDNAEDGQEIPVVQDETVVQDPNETYYTADNHENYSPAPIMKEVTMTNAITLETVKTVRDESTVWLTLINGSWLTEYALFDQLWYESKEQTYSPMSSITSEFNAVTKEVTMTNANTLETMQTVRDECLVWLTLINGSWLTEDELHEQGWYEGLPGTTLDQWDADITEKYRKIGKAWSSVFQMWLNVVEDVAPVTTTKAGEGFGRHNRTANTLRKQQRHANRFLASIAA